jgi:hypothetical protein
MFWSRPSCRRRSALTFSIACGATLALAVLSSTLPARADLQYIAALPAAAGKPDQSISSKTIISKTSITNNSAKPDFPLASNFSRRLQHYTGINWLGRTVTASVASVVLQRKLGGHVRVHLKTYSFTDLVAGKVKSINVDVRDPKLSGVTLGHIELSSSAPIWYAYKKPKAGEIRGLRTATVLAVRATVSQKQIARALENPRVAAKLHGLKLDLPGLGEQQLEILEPRVLIVEDLLKVEGTLVTRGASAATGVPVKISARPTLVGDSQIVLDNLTVDSADIVDPEKFADFTAKLLNPVVDFARMDRRDHAFRLDNLKVSGSEGAVVGDGRLLLVPKVNPGGSQLAQSHNAIVH